MQTTPLKSCSALPVEAARSYPGELEEKLICGNRKDVRPVSCTVLV